MTKQADPIHRTDNWLFYTRFWAAQTAALFFNPLFLIWMVAQAVGQLVCLVRMLWNGTQIRSAVPVDFPLDGSWLVANGGATRKTSHSWGLISQRYAYDFTVDVDGPCPNLEGWPAFGAAVGAAADGRVVDIMDGISDYARPGTGWFDWRTRDPRGNWVLVDHGDGVFGLYAHLRMSSVLVRLGQEVSKGERIGSCGNSGFSTEPHLHFQLQDRRNFFLAHGVLPAFRNVIRAPEDSSEYDGILTADQTAKRGEKTRPLKNLPTFDISAGFEPVFVSFMALAGIFLALRALIGIALRLIAP